MNFTRIKNAGFFFIAGRGRSGTTLLSTLLDSHPGIVVAPESGFVLAWARKYCYKTLDLAARRQFLADLESDRRIFNRNNSWGVCAEALRRDLLNPELDFDYAALCRLVILHSCSQQDSESLLTAGSKFPVYALFLKPLARFFPAARFIILTRDYRDNVLSYKNVPYEPSHSVAFYAWRWRWYNRQVVKFLQDYPGRGLQVRYEDLVLKPEAELRRICNFLGVPFIREMLNFHENRERYQQHSGRLQALKGLRPVNAASLGRHRLELQVEERAQIGLLCRSLASKLGYPAEPVKRLSPMSIVGLYLNLVPAAAYTVAEVAAMYLPRWLRFLVPWVNNLVLRIRGARDFF